MRLFVFFVLLINVSFTPAPVMEFTPERISRCSVILLDGPVENVFPLFGPIREKEWAEGWDPQIIYSTTNLAEEHMIFRTQAHHVTEPHFTWVITQYDPAKHQIEYTVSTAERIWFIRVDCSASGQKTTAKICYTYTGLTAEGNKRNLEAMETMYAHDLEDWEKALNFYLRTGKKLTHP